VSKKKTSSSNVDVLAPSDMANWLVLSEQELANLTKNGVVKRSSEKTESGRHRVVYKVKETVGAYVMHLKAPSIEARNQFILEKGLTQQIIRAQKELELAKQRGDLIERSRITLIVTQLLSTVKNHVLAIPQRCARMVRGMTSVPEINTILANACELTLREASEFNINDVLKPVNSTNGQHDHKRTRAKAKVRSK
jgi:hypothetical protein